MYRNFLHIFKKFDWVLLASALFLILLGLQAIYSLSFEETGLSRFDKQSLALMIGLILFVALSIFDYRRLGGLSWVLYGLSLVLLIAVLIFGATLRGTTGWFLFGQVSFQPVELVKVLSLVTLAYYLSKVSRPGSQQAWLTSLGILLPIFVLLLLQPDFAPVLLLLLIWFILNASFGLKLKGWLISISLVLILGALAWFWLLTPAQQQRIVTFVNPTADEQGSGFQIKQSIIAVGTGGLTGRGVGEGFQSQLAFLPAAATDFVFASMLEERGLTGFVLITGLFGLFFWRIWLMIKKSQDAYTQYLVLGLGLLFAIQALLNMAMNVGLAPVVGLPLPFLSYGASALIGELVALGILMSIAVRQKI